MRTIGDTIKILREERRMSQEQLADALNLSRSSIGMYESGKRIPKDDIKELICDYFNVDMNYLHGKTNTRNSTREGEAIKNLVPFEVKEIPILGKIACGEPIFADEECSQYSTVSGIHADFALEAQGDSMIGDRIYNGDIVFCRNQPTVENGEIAVVIIKDEATLKHFFYYPDRGLVILKASIKKLQFILSIFALFLSVLALFSVVFKNFYTIFYTTKKRGPKTSQSLLSLQFVNLYRNCYNSNRDLDKPENSFENFRFHYLPPSQPEGGLFFTPKLKTPFRELCLS